MPQVEKWSSQFLLGFSPIDEQHKQLLNLIFYLQSTDIGEDDRDAMGSVLFKLLVFTETHLIYEEELLKLLGFKQIEKHLGQHEFMRLKTREIVYNHTKGLIYDKGEILDMLQGWWVSHILEEDMQYQPLLVEHGLTT